MPIDIKINRLTGFDATNYCQLYDEQPIDLEVLFPSGTNYTIQKFLLTSHSEFFTKLLEGEDTEKFILIVEDELAFDLVLILLQSGDIRIREDLHSRVINLLRDLQLDFDYDLIESSELLPPVNHIIGSRFIESEEDSSESESSASSSSCSSSEMAANVIEAEEVDEMAANLVLEEKKQFNGKRKRQAEEENNEKSRTKEPVKGSRSLGKFPCKFPTRERKPFRSLFYHGERGDDKF